MAQRITRSFLNAQVSNLNRLFGLDDEVYTYDENDKIIGGVEGVYLISSQYGGFALHKMHESTGQSDIFNMGHIPARQLSELIDAYMRGIREVMNIKD
jgi:hypothetical protein